MKRGIEWVVLVTDDYARSYAFYKNTLGFNIEREVEDEQFCQFALLNCFLAIYGRDEFSKLLGEGILGNPGGAVYSFPESRDIDEDYKELKDKGVEFLKEPETQPWGQRTAYFRDPDGHIWELQQWTHENS